MVNSSIGKAKLWFDSHLDLNALIVPIMVHGDKKYCKERSCPPLALLLA